MAEGHLAALSKTLSLKRSPVPVSVPKAGGSQLRQVPMILDAQVIIDLGLVTLLPFPPQGGLTLSRKWVILGGRGKGKRTPIMEYLLFQSGIVLKLR